MIKYYIYLIKPRIVIGNISSSIGGFLIAKGNIFSNTFCNMIIGISCIIAAGCVFNNIIDRDIDSLMERTKNRILAQTDLFFLRKSIFYAIILTILGFLFLSFIHILLIIWLSIVGLLTYVIVYTIWMKRTSIYSTIIGSISGSMPPVIGYCTVTETFDIGAIILLIIFSLWQIPHSYSFIIMQLNDYNKASIPTFPSKKGIKLTQFHMLIHILAFIVSTILFTYLGYTSLIFLLIISIANGLWMYIGYTGYKYLNNNYVIQWAKKMFSFSILIILLLNLLLSIDNIFIKINLDKNL